MPELYLDYSATTPVRPEVLRAMWPVYQETFANPASVHTPGKQTRERLDWARMSVAKTLNCASEQVIFTSGGTESDNLAIVGAALANPRGRHVVISAVEHPAVKESAQYLHKFHNFRVTEVPVDAHGTISLEVLERVLTPETTICSVMHANNEVGTVQPIEQIATLCGEAGVPFHTDAVQTAGWFDLQPVVAGASAVSMSGHKFGATKGVGVLVRSPGLALEPTVFGGGQQGGLRSGTEDVAGPVGFAVALALAANETQTMGNQSIEAMRDDFVHSVLSRIPSATLTGHPTERLPGHASFVFPKVNGEALLIELDVRSIACSSGSACAAGSQDPSPTLLAMGLSEQDAHTAVRFSFGRDTSADDLSHVTDVLVAAHQGLTR